MTARGLGLIIIGYIALAGVDACSTPGPQPAPPPASASASPPPVTATPDPYHPAPRDTVGATAYKGWQLYSLHCARCHGEDAQGTSFAPSLVTALRPDGHVPSREDFIGVLSRGRPDKGMPSGAKMGIDSTYFAGLYEYLKGRSDGRLHGGRPARRDT